jgi:hypothetical protein
MIIEGKEMNVFMKNVMLLLNNLHISNLLHGGFYRFTATLLYSQDDIN